MRPKTPLHLSRYKYLVQLAHLSNDLYEPHYFLALILFERQLLDKLSYHACPVKLCSVFNSRLPIVVLVSGGFVRTVLDKHVRQPGGQADWQPHIIPP